MSDEKESKKAREAASMAESVNTLMLQETIKNLEESKVRLLLTIKDLKEKLEQQKADQADIYYYLNKKCDESFEIIASLEEQLSNEQSDREIAEKMYEAKIEELRSILQSTETKMSARIIDLEGKVEMLNQFAHAKEETDRKLAELTQTLDRERADYHQTVEILENKFLIEREKLRASYDQKYEVLKKDLEQSIDGKLSKKTQRTQIMNVVMKKELEAQSRHADRLLEINDEIVDRDKKLKIELDLARSLKDELLRKCNMYTRTNKELEKKVGDAKSEQEKLTKELEEQLSVKTKEAEEIRQLLVKERTRNNQKAGKMDELWFFLSKAYQILGVNRTATSQVEEQSADYYSNVLLELFKHLSVKFPEFMTRFMSDQVAMTGAAPGPGSFSGMPPASGSQRVSNSPPTSFSAAANHNRGSSSVSVATMHGTAAAADDRSLFSKEDVGIFSWRTEKFADPRPARLQVQTRTTGVQTDYLYAIDHMQQQQQPNSSRSQYNNSYGNSQFHQVETGSLWKPYPGQLSSSSDDGIGNSVGVFSLPTVLGNTNNNNNTANNANHKTKRTSGTSKVAHNNTSNNGYGTNIMGGGLTTSSLISAVTIDDSSMSLQGDGNHSLASNSIAPNGDASLSQSFDAANNHSFHTISGPVHQKKPLNRSSSHQTKNRKLKFPEKGNNLGPTAGGSINNNNMSNASGLILDDWQDSFYLDRNSKGLYGGNQHSSNNYPALEEGSATSFMELSISGHRFHDNNVHHSSNNSNHILPKLI